MASTAKILVAENAALVSPLDAGGIVSANTLIFIPTYDNGTPLVGDAKKSIVPQKHYNGIVQAVHLPLNIALWCVVIKIKFFNSIAYYIEDNLFM